MQREMRGKVGADLVNIVSLEDIEAFGTTRARGGDRYRDGAGGAGRRQNDEWERNGAVWKERERRRGTRQGRRKAKLT